MATAPVEKTEGEDTHSKLLMVYRDASSKVSRLPLIQGLWVCKLPQSWEFVTLFCGNSSQTSLLLDLELSAYLFQFYLASTDLCGLNYFDYYFDFVALYSNHVHIVFGDYLTAFIILKKYS